MYYMSNPALRLLACLYHSLEQPYTGRIKLISISHLRKQRFIFFNKFFYAFLIILVIHSFFKYILLIMLLQLSQFFSPFLSLLPVTPPSPSSISPTPQFMSMGRTCKLFGFSISYTILNLPLTILCLPILLLTSCTFSLHCTPLPPH